MPEAIPTILVVEDNPITRKMLRVTFESEGYRVIAAEDGRSALATVAGRRPDLIIQDFVLPDMTGTELVTQIHGTPEGEGIPVILLTGHSTRMQEFLATGLFAAVLVKPIEPSWLIATARTLLAPVGAVHRAPRAYRVLVVDDNASNRKLAQAQLTLVGHHVSTVASVEDALAAARQDKPDVILADVLMPGLDGFQLCLAVRKEPGLADIPIVLATSSYDEHADRDLALRSGAADLVLRTPSYAEAIEAVERALRSGAPRPPASGASLDQEYVATLRRQVDRQMAHNAQLAERTAIHGAALSMMGALAEALAKPREVVTVLGDLLIHCLDAAGLSTGLLYLSAPEGPLRLHTSAGLPATRYEAGAAAFHHPELLRPTPSGEPRAFSATLTTDPVGQAFLAQFGHSSALVVPFVVLQHHYGSLVLGSDDHDLTDTAWGTFGRALAAQFGQAVALAQTMADLADSEELLRRAVDASPSGMITTDSAGNIVTANRQISTIFGYTEAELLGQPVEVLLPQRYRGQHRAQRDAFQAAPVSRAMGADRALFGRHKDGREIPVEIGLAPVTRRNEHFVIASVIDITERRKAEQEVREREERFRQIADNIKEVFFVVDAQFRETLYISPAYETLWGRSCQSLYDAPESFLEPLPAGDRARVMETIAQAQRGEDPGDVEFRVVHPDGHVRWVRAHAVPVRDDRNAVYRIAGVVLDITERRESEDALRTSEGRARTLFETVDLVVLGLDPEGRVNYANPFLLQLTGHSIEEVLGEPWVERFIPAAGRAAMHEAFARLLERHAHPHHQNAILTKAGKERMITWSNTVLTTPDGQPAGTLSVGQDITEQLSLEQQFLQAQKMEAVGRLAGGVAHDFNNLLTAILGYAGLMREEMPANDPRGADLDEITHAARRAADLTRQLLAFSRQQVLQPRVVSVSDSVEGLANMLRRLLGEDLQLVTVPPPGNGHVLVDPGQLEQVIVNLAVNARDAMPSGGTLTIETSVVDLDETFTMLHEVVKPGPYVVLAVSDTGTGMTDEVKAHIFEPFFTTKGVGKGTGLGLATVYGIVKQSGGTLSVYSEVGRGTTFRIYLPLVNADATLPQSQESKGAAGGSETILLVEDEEAVRRITRETLRRRGYTVIEAPSADEALKLLGRHPPGSIHLVLTDLVLPGMAGHDLATHVAEHRPEIVVILMSGYTERALFAQQLFTAGTTFIQKPFAPEVLARTVRTALDAAKA